MKKIEIIKDYIYDLLDELLVCEVEPIMDLTKIQGKNNCFRCDKFSYENLENVNLENSNLDINLRKISVKEFKNDEYGDSFIKINKSNLKGNNVYGGLEPLNNEIYFWYSEDTFDDSYKSKYNKFFLNENAPYSLKDKYYNPKMKLVISNKKQYIVFIKNTLTFDEYMDNYDFLKGKYLGNFSISDEEKKKICCIDKDAFDNMVTKSNHLSLMYRKK